MYLLNFPSSGSHLLTSPSLSAREKKSKLSSLIEDVKNFEPLLALDGGPDGFSAILKVIAKSSKLLKKNGMLFLEIDNTQVIKTKQMLKTYKFFTKDVCKDLSGNNRCITAIKL